MRTQFLKTAGFFLLLTILILSCQKETNETSVINSVAAKNEKPKNECRITYLSLNTSIHHRFHYNENGLADNWTIDYGDGIPDEYLINYDHNGHITTVHNNYDGLPWADIQFEYNGNRVSKESWYDPSTNDL